MPTPPSRALICTHYFISTFPPPISFCKSLGPLNEASLQCLLLLAMMQACIPFAHTLSLFKDGQHDCFINHSCLHYKSHYTTLHHTMIDCLFIFIPSFLHESGAGASCIYPLLGVRIMVWSYSTLYTTHHTTCACQSQMVVMALKKIK